jgi:peptide-methionine (S)-S-oxide reductase
MAIWRYHIAMKARLGAVILLAALAGAAVGGVVKADETNRAQESADKRVEVLMVGAGCFWCTEAVFQRIDGVIAVKSGYAGGTTTNPTYRQVCEGDTGHAEVTRIEFDPEKVTYAELLDLFWRMHDPTTLNRQGADVGTQYRSVIFTFSDEQKREAEASKAALAASGKYKDPIVTEIVPAAPFYPAEDYHQEYFNRNRGAMYCRMIIMPKLRKLGMDKEAAVPAGK